MNSDFIQSIDLFRNVDAEICSMVAAVCTPVNLQAGELLIEAGADDTDLYVLESGQLEVILNDKLGVDRVVNSLHPGQSVGETALLTGTSRSASVRAVADSIVHRITRSDFDSIADSNPEFRGTVESGIYSRIHNVHLSSALYENTILGSLDAEILKDIYDEIELEALKKGDQLVTQGAPSDSLYIVVSGRLRVFEQPRTGNTIEPITDSDAELRPVVDIGRGQTVGEIGFLSGEPRNASVYALRDSLVGRLGADSYYKLLQKYPKPLTQLFSSKILGRLVNPPKKKNHTFALIGINAGGDLQPTIEKLAKRLCWHLENPWTGNKPPRENITATYIDKQTTDQALGKTGISEARINSAAHLRLQNWLNEQESNNGYLFLGASYPTDSASTTPDNQLEKSQSSSWITRISEQVDHIIFVARADTDLSTITLPELSDNNSQDLPLDPGSSLVLLHPEHCTMPNDTSAWLDKFSVDSHHHIRWSDNDEIDWKDPAKSDIARASRLITQQGIGLVLSGGAARGFAHIGVVRAMHEAGVPIDLLGGASAGAISASIIAAGHDDDQAKGLVLKYGKRKNMNDYTLPSTALFAGKRFSSLMRSFVGEIQIEDLWTPFYCVSINLANASEVVHRQGALWKYVRASASMPIMLPPVADEGQLLADGATLNALPVEIMRDDPGCGTVIAIDVSGGTGMRGEFVYGTELSGWRQLVRKLNPLSKPYRSPALASTILAISAIGAVGRIPSQRAQADLYIRPPVYKFKMMDYDSREQIMEVGYQTAKTEIAGWLKKNKK